MAEQLGLWGDRDDEPQPVEDQALVEFQTPAEPTPKPAPELTKLDRELELLLLDFLGLSAQRIARAVEHSQTERRAEFIRMINVHLAIGKLSIQQRDSLLEIVWGHEGADNDSRTPAFSTAQGLVRFCRLAHSRMEFLVCRV